MIRYIHIPIMSKEVKDLMLSHYTSMFRLCLEKLRLSHNQNDFKPQLLHGYFAFQFGIVLLL